MHNLQPEVQSGFPQAGAQSNGDTGKNPALGCLLSLARALASLVLGVIVFVGLFYLIVLGGRFDKLLDASFYTGVLEDTNAYGRVYDEAAHELHDNPDETLAGIRLVTPEETADLLREIMPPEDLQPQVEGVIGRAVSYLRGDSEELEAYIEFGPALDRVRPVLLQYIERRIDQVEPVASGIPDCSPDAVRRLASGYVDRYQQLSGGVAPTTVPLLASLTGLCRALVFEAVYAALAASELWNTRNLDSAGDIREPLRLAFDSGDTHAAIKILAHQLAGPRIDEAVEGIRSELAPGDRLDLVYELAKDGHSTEEEVRAELDEFRGPVSATSGIGQPVALAIIIVGSVIVGLLHLPNWAGVVRWPGITLLLSSIVCLVADIALQAEIPGLVETVVEQETSGRSIMATGLAHDVAAVVGAGLADASTWTAITFIVVGVALFLVSFHPVVYRAIKDYRTLKK